MSETPENNDNYSHDKSYKQIFSHAELVQQLVEGFAPPELVELIDFSTLTIVSGNYITPNLDERHDDVVWKVSIGDTYLYLYLLLEFQSTPDLKMPVRILQYVAALYDALIKSKAIDPKQLPPIFPIVIYNGDTRWKIATNINTIIHCPPILKPYQPNLSYYLLDEGAYPTEALNDINNIVSSIFNIENAKNDQQARVAIQRLAATVNALPNKTRIDRVISHWVIRYLKHFRAEIIIDHIELMEDTSMLATNVEKWFESAEQRGEQRGRQEGEGTGMVKMFLNMLAMRFPNFDVQAYKEKISSAAEDQLNRYSAKLFTAKTPEEVFADDEKK